MGMLSMFPGGTYNDEPSSLNTEYNSVVGGTFQWTTSPNAVYNLMPCSGYFIEIRTDTDTAPGAGNSITASLYKNGSATSLQAVMEDSETSAEGFTAVAVVPGDRIAIQTVPYSSPSRFQYRWVTVFSGAANVSAILGHGTVGENGADEQYHSFCDSEHVGGAASEVNAARPVAASGTISDLYVYAPYTIASSYSIVCTVRKDGADTDLVATLTAGTGPRTANDTTNSVTVVPGEDICLETYCTDPNAALAGNAPLFFSVKFTSEVNGESILFGGSQDSPSTSSVEYIPICSRKMANWGGSNENYNGQLTSDFVWRRLYVKTTAAPSAGDYYDILLRDDGADTDLSVRVNDTETEDWYETDVTPAAGSIVNIKSSPYSYPDLGDYRWGFALYKTPISEIEDLVKIIDEALQLGEVRNKIFDLVRRINETLNISESLIKYVFARLRIVNESLNLSEVSVIPARKLVRVIGRLLRVWGA